MLGMSTAVWPYCEHGKSKAGACAECGRERTIPEPLSPDMIARLQRLGYEAVPIDVMDTLRKLFVHG